MKRLSILYVEDEPSDVDLARKVLDQSNLAASIDLNVVEDGEQAIAYLNQQPPHEKERCPDLVLLDLNIPSLSGQEVLKHIKTSERLRTLPVVIFSTSGSQQEVDAAYTLGASMFIPKPMTMEGLKALFKSLYVLWGEHNRFPSITLKERPQKN